MTSSVRIGSSTNSSKWPPKIPENDSLLGELLFCSETFNTAPEALPTLSPTSQPVVLLSPEEHRDYSNKLRSKRIRIGASIHEAGACQGRRASLRIGDTLAVLAECLTSRHSS